MNSYDLVIRGGVVADGEGGELYEADVAIVGDRIAAVGEVAGSGREEIDAKGRLVTPGWVDIHTHYDGQATWDSRLTPSSIHGATTVVVGNCGVGFAPVRPGDHERLIRLMEGVEDIPGAALHEGLTWEWETFGEYLDALERRPRDIDIGAQVPHAALRVYVMGERGANRERSTPEEARRMGTLTAEALRAGALGFSTTRTYFHRTADGDFTPTVRTEDAELEAIAAAMGEAGSGVFEWASDFEDVEREFELMKRLTRISGRPLSFSLLQVNVWPDQWRELMTRLDAAAAEGYPIRGQVQGRPVGLLLGLQGSVHPFVNRPSYLALADRPVAERAALLRDPALRARILAEPSPEGHPLVNSLAGAFDKMFELGDPPEYEPPPEQSLAARAARQGVAAEALAYDLMCAGDGAGLLFFALHNYEDGDLDAALTMMRNPNTVLGLYDGGAHVGAICDVSTPTYMLSHWCRDRTRGTKLEIPWVVRSQTRDTARAVGLFDRGVLAPGFKADVNIIDFDRLKLKPPHMVYDLPSGARRLMQEAEGYDATVMSGAVTYREGHWTGALPGKVVRGSQPAPA